MSEWVTEAKLRELTGLTRGQVKSNRQRRRWKRGVEYAEVNGRLEYNMPAINRRADEQAASQVERAIEGERSLRVIQLQ